MGGEMGGDMDRHAPRVTIGIPVYNGENYLAKAIESALAQTYDDFEIVISDNASTDRTAEICREYAERDGRVRYLKNEVNLGASPNYRRTFDEARGEFFCWMPHDDAMLPEFLARCVEVLDAEPDVVLAYSYYLIRQASDDPTPLLAGRDADLRLPTAHERIRVYFREQLIGPNWPIFGLYRRSVLGETQLLRPLIGADDYVTLEVVVRGKVAQIPEELYVLRTHPDAWHEARQRDRKGLARIFGTETKWAAEWFDPANKSLKVVFPHWRRLREYFLVFWRSPASIRSKVSMTAVLPRYAAHRWKRLAKEALVGTLQWIVVTVRSLLSALVGAGSSSEAGGDPARSKP